VVFCPECRTPGAYVGLLKIECPSTRCKHYSAKWALVVTPAQPPAPALLKLEEEEIPFLRTPPKGEKGYLRALERKRRELAQEDRKQREYRLHPYPYVGPEWTLQDAGGVVWPLPTEIVLRVDHMTLLEGLFFDPAPAGVRISRFIDPKGRSLFWNVPINIATAQKPFGLPSPVFLGHDGYHVCFEFETAKDAPVPITFRAIFFLRTLFADEAQRLGWIPR
jgi:hypothetical protein